MNPKLWVVAAIVFALNLPFGYWRAGSRRFSLAWLAAIHAPVPAVVALRLVSGLGWHWVTYPVLIGAFAAGQFSGGRLRRLGCGHFSSSPPPTSIGGPARIMEDEEERGS